MEPVGHVFQRKKAGSGPVRHIRPAKQVLRRQAAAEQPPHGALSASAFVAGSAAAHAVSSGGVAARSFCSMNEGQLGSTVFGQRAPLPDAERLPDQNSLGRRR